MSRNYPVLAADADTVRFDTCEHSLACTRLAAMNGRTAQDIDSYLMCRFCHAYASAEHEYRGRHFSNAYV